MSLKSVDKTKIEPIDYNILQKNILCRLKDIRYQVILDL